MSTKKCSKTELCESFRRKFGSRVHFEERLAPYVAFGVGGPAEILVFPKTMDELAWLSSQARSHDLSITVIGTGTNLLVVDEGIRGIVISLYDSFNDIEVIDESPTQTLIKVGGGVEKPHLLNWAISKNLGGLEFSAGVPGTIGGGIYMNAGTQYGSYGDILSEVQLFDFHQGPINLKREEVHFGYREQTAVKDTLVIFAVFKLTPSPGHLVKAEVDRIIAERAAKQPLDHPSCGSTFKNPPGHSAGRLIEKAGLKGLRIGGAEISIKHGNFILNKDNATATDILSLIEKIKNHVKQDFGVDLHCEVITLGPQGKLKLAAP